MFLTIEQIFDIKFILAGIDKKDIPKDLNISKPMLSKLSQSKPAQKKLDEYFDKINPEINSIVNKLTEMISVNEAKEPIVQYQKRSISAEKYIELQERLLKSQEDRLKYLEKERAMFIEKYGDVYK